MGRSPVSAKVVRFIVGSTELIVRGNFDLVTKEKMAYRGQIGCRG